jgi:formylglycine-generating enzyme required for sulfatase activity
MKKRLYVTILGGIAAALLVFGCDFLLGPDAPVGAGNLVIGFGESGPAAVSLAAVPTPEEQAALRYELVLTGPGDQKIEVSVPAGGSYTGQVALGEWHIYAEAYSPGNALTGTGSATVTVRAGMNQARVPMQVVEAFVAVSNITGVPTVGTAGENLTLNGTVTPTNATSQTIVWSVKTPGGTGAGISGNSLSTTGAGTVVVTATIANGLAAGTDYTQDFNILINAIFVAVTGITGVPTSGTVGTPIPLSGTVAPTNANQTIVWSIKTDGGTGTSISEDILSAANAGTVLVTATIANGTAAGTDYTQDFSITINSSPVQMTRPISGVNVPFRYVPAGSFQRDNTTANVSVITKGYWMGETEVTQELFEVVLGNNPSSFTSGADSGETQNKRPVENINWYAAIAFCNKLSLLDGKDPVYSVTELASEVAWATLTYSAIPIGATNADWDAATMDINKNGYRLPTEMEWMWAAMGADMANPGQPNITGYGKTYAGSTETGTSGIDGYVWYTNNSNSKTHEVGKKAANELGLKDMSGNVQEWCWDWGGSYPNETITDYTGDPGPGSDRILRGLGWDVTVNGCPIFLRTIYTPDSQSSNLGFRVVCAP